MRKVTRGDTPCTPCTDAGGGGSQVMVVVLSPAAAAKDRGPRKTVQRLGSGSSSVVQAKKAKKKQREAVEARVLFGDKEKRGRARVNAGVVNPSTYPVLLEDDHPKHLQSGSDLSETSSASWRRGRHTARADRARRKGRTPALPPRACSRRSRRG